MTKVECSTAETESFFVFTLSTQRVLLYFEFFYHT